MDTPARHRALPPPTARLLSRPEAAAYAGVSPSTFDKLMADGLMPGPVRLYSRTLWDVRGLDAAIDCLLDGAELPKVSDEDNGWDEVLQ